MSDLSSAFSKASEAAPLVSIDTIASQQANAKKAKAEAAKAKRIANNDEGEDNDDGDQKLSRRKKRSLEDVKTREGAERLSHTLFIGNVPLDVTEKQLKTLLKSNLKEKMTEADVLPDIVSVRFRSVPIEKVAISSGGNYKDMLKAAAITGSLASDTHDAKNAYVVFSSPIGVSLSLSLNGTEFNGHHLRVDRADSDGKYDPKRTVFVGNLPFDLKDEELRTFFAEKVGESSIEGIRVVRDKLTRLAKGIAFVLMSDRLGVADMLGLDGEKFQNRKIRVTRSSADGRPLDGENAKKSSVKAALPKFMGQIGAPKEKAKLKGKVTGGKKSFSLKKPGFKSLESFEKKGKPSFKKKSFVKGAPKGAKK